MIKELHNETWQPKYLYLLIVALVTTFLTSNILAYKYVQIGDIKFGAAAVIFPFSLVVGDALSEVYGFRQTRKAIFISLISYLFFMIIAYITVILPPAPEWTMQADYEKFFSTTPRVFLASSLAFIVSQIINSYIMIKIKAAMHGKSFYVRALAATIIGELAHTIVVAPILFGKILSLDQLIKLIFTATTIKIIVEIMILPLTYIIILKLKNAEGVDFYDK